MDYENKSAVKARGGSFLFFFDLFRIPPRKEEAGLLFPKETMKIFPEPKVTLVNAFERPFDNAVATARTCYSAHGIVTAEDVGGGEGQDQGKLRELHEKRDRLARSIFKAGHHTTLQHAHFQFALENVSRQFLWAFLHSHPFYNSEQVSQRYVTVKPDAMAHPPLEGEAASIYEDALHQQIEVYHKLTQRLHPIVDAEYRKRFPYADRMGKRAQSAIQKKAQEVARYVLPVATQAYLYHTISAVTLLRYYRACRQPDVPLEQKIVVQQMVEEVLRADPAFRVVLQEPLPPSCAIAESIPPPWERKESVSFRKNFDATLEGKVSKLVDWSPRALSVLAASVREIAGLTEEELSDVEAVRRVLDPERNPIWGQTLNLSFHDKLTRAAHHVHYVFRKKLSHTADSQDQRHRMTPASRPFVGALSLMEPDFIRPVLIRQDAGIEKQYVESMEKTWEAIRRLLALGVSREFASYLLPNAVAVRFTESADLLYLHHKHAMRLCYNAQEEIWQASVEEAAQIREVHPEIGRWLLPPCGVRHRAKVKPICPEGERFCGVVVWKLDLSDYQRVI